MMKFQDLITCQNEIKFSEFSKIALFVTVFTYHVVRVSTALLCQTVERKRR